MAKEKDETTIETLEGGEEESDALVPEDTTEEKVIEVKDEEDEEDGVSTKKPDAPEEVRFKDGDADWDKESESLDEFLEGLKEKEGTEEKEVEQEKTVEEIEKEEKGVEKKEEIEEKEEKIEEKLSEEEKQDKKIQEDVIKYLSEEEGGTKFIVKGKEHDMRDLSPQEWKQRFSLAGRAYQVMEDNAEQRKQLDIERTQLDEAARNSQELMDKYGGKKSGDTSEELPDVLKPNNDDSDTEKALKEISTSLYHKVDKLESDGKQQDFRAQEQDLYRQLDSLEKEFPMLSKSEVIAVKSMPEFAKADLRLIAENSHNNRVSDEYLDSVKKARPEYFRELEEKAVEKHQKANPSIRKISRKKSSSVASGKISTGKKFAPNSFEELEDHLDKVKGDLEED